MSDTFDHELDAFEQAEAMDWCLDDAAPTPAPRRPRKQRQPDAFVRDYLCTPDEGWNCKHCGAWHPAVHESCWYCNDGKKKGFKLYGRLAHQKEVRS